MWWNNLIRKTRSCKSAPFLKNLDQKRVLTHVGQGIPQQVSTPNLWLRVWARSLATQSENSFDSPYDGLAKADLQKLCDERYISRWGSHATLVKKLTNYDMEMEFENYAEKSDEELREDCVVRGLSSDGKRSSLIQRLLNFEMGSFEESPVEHGVTVSMKNNTSIKVKQGYNKAFHIVKWYLRKRRKGTIVYQKGLPTAPDYVVDFLQILRPRDILGRDFKLSEMKKLQLQLTGKMRGFRDANGFDNGGRKTLKRSTVKFVWQPEVTAFVGRAKYQFFKDPERINCTAFIFNDPNDPEMIGDIVIDWEPGKRSMTAPHARLNIPSTFADTLQKRINSVTDVSLNNISLVRLQELESDAFQLVNFLKLNHTLVVKTCASQNRYIDIGYGQLETLKVFSGEVAKLISGDKTGKGKEWYGGTYHSLMSCCSLMHNALGEAESQMQLRRSAVNNFRARERGEKNAKVTSKEKDDVVEIEEEEEELAIADTYEDGIEDMEEVLDQELDEDGDEDMDMLSDLEDHEDDHIPRYSTVSRSYR